MAQLIQQRLRVLQVRRIETFGEPIVDRTEQITGFRALALVAPEPGEAGRCPQLEELCALPLGNGDGLTIVPLGPGSIAGGIQQIARHPMQQLSFNDPLVGGLDDPRSLGEAVLCFSRLPEHGVGLGEPREQHRRTDDASGSTQFRQPLREQRKAFLCLPERDQRPSADMPVPNPNNTENRARSIEPEIPRCAP